MTTCCITIILDGFVKSQKARHSGESGNDEEHSFSTFYEAIILKNNPYPSRTGKYALGFPGMGSQAASAMRRIRSSRHHGP